MSVEPLVFTTREAGVEDDRPAPGIDSPAVENVHLGSIAVMSADGGLTHWVGDPHWSTFTRSTLKPFQALSFVREGGPARFGWDSRHVALMCASHSGEAMHTGIVASMLASADCEAECLQCGSHVPGWYGATGRIAPVDAQWSPLEPTCSGKRAGFLAACRLHGEPVDGYLDPSSPLQRRVAVAVADVADLALHGMACGTDGCSAPNYALPLSRLALLYAQLGQGSAAAREGDALGVLFDAMTRHPELVSGTARSDLGLMSQAPGDWVAKIGADGVQAIGIRSAGIGIAIKIVDGSRGRPPGPRGAGGGAPPGVTRVDSQADVENRFAPWYRRDLRNARGRAIGRMLPAFRLRAA